MSQEMYSRLDLSSLSNSTKVVSVSIHLDWTIDFDAKSISGLAKHKVSVLETDVETVDFDSSQLNIRKVTINGSVSKFTVSDAATSLGSKISVPIPEKLRVQGSAFEVAFDYSTDKEATAIQWLEPSATKGKRHPYVFTQCQAIHARSLLPCMDSPGVKTTYTAKVRAPEWCTVLMSALSKEADPGTEMTWTTITTPTTSPTATPIKSSEGEIKSPNSSDKRNKKNKRHDKQKHHKVEAPTESGTIPVAGKEVGVFYWSQPVPTPAYLIALAAGDLASRDISERVRIWAEPEVVDSAAFEFSETEEFLRTAESLTCPYQWTRYDVLCLPPSFPYGGMENPCLTFATPTLLAGDKSLADVIAHEIAHSWTGNLVTNHTWSHFWLNEGWTVWLERKIMSRVKNNEEFLKLSAQGGWKHLKDDVSRMGDDNKFTCLVWPLAEGADPDDAFSSVPYEKGFNFLNYLESIVGSTQFEQFAKNYINQFKFKTVTSGDFKDFFMDQFAASVPSVNDIDWDTWFHVPGLPAVALQADFTNSLSHDAVALAAEWLDVEKSGVSLDSKDFITSTSIETWSTQQKSIFLETLLSHVENNENPLKESTLLALNDLYAFNATNNSEIKFRWQSLCLHTDECVWIIPRVIDFITTQGRMKFVRPLYRLLRASKNSSGTAKDTFERFSDTYHPIARKMIATDLSNADLEDENEAAGNIVPNVNAAESIEPVETVDPVDIPVEPAVIQDCELSELASMHETFAVDESSLAPASEIVEVISEANSLPVESTHEALFHDVLFVPVTAEAEKISDSSLEEVPSSSTDVPEVSQSNSSNKSSSATLPDVSMTEFMTRYDSYETMKKFIIPSVPSKETIAGKEADDASLRYLDNFPGAPLHTMTPDQQELKGAMDSVFPDDLHLIPSKIPQNESTTGEPEKSQSKPKRDKTRTSSSASVKAITAVAVAMTIIGVAALVLFRPRK